MDDPFQGRGQGEHSAPWGWYCKWLLDGRRWRCVVFSPTGVPLSDHPTWWSAIGDALARRPLGWVACPPGHPA